MFNVRFRLFCPEARFKRNKRSIILPAVYLTRHFERNVLLMGLIREIGGRLSNRGIRLRSGTRQEFRFSRLSKVLTTSATKFHEVPLTGTHGIQI